MNDWRSRPISTAAAKPAASIARLSISFVGAITSGSTRARRSASASTSAGQSIAGHHAVDEPDPLRLDRVDQVARQQQLARLLLADEERHQQRHRRRPEADLGLAEARVLRGDDEVAGHRQLEAAGERVAVDLGDDGFRAVEDRERRLDVLAEDLAPAPRGVGLALGQVVAGAERPTGAGDRDDADALVVRGVGDRGADSSSRSSALIAFSLSGRLSVRRTPQPVGSRRTSGSPVIRARPRGRRPRPRRSGRR